MSRLEGRVAADLHEILRSAFERALGERLVSLVLFGSRARGDAREDSDIDVLVVADGLPGRHGERYESIWPALREAEARLDETGWAGFPEISYILYSREEAARFRRLYFDVAWDGVLLVDREGFMSDVLGRVRRRMEGWGSRRVTVGRKWYWDLKPGKPPGEVLEI